MNITAHHKKKFTLLVFHLSAFVDPSDGINRSKCLRAAFMLSCVSVVGTLAAEPAMMTIMYVLPVKRSIKAENCELRTSIPCSWLCVFEQDSLNCLMMLETRSKRWLS